ncbi:MAG: hypothetical protein AAGA61_01885 [Pseudomonadota bacterium]
MSTKISQDESPTSAWKNDAARQRWELFHRAIAHAKKSNTAALDSSDDATRATKPARPLLYVAK